MIGIEKVDHIGIRVQQKQRSIAFYEKLGFQFISDTGFEQGHPIMMEHPGGVVLNLLGPSTDGEDHNILMDIEEKHAGYTHMALKVTSLEETEAFFDEQGIAITGRFSFKDMSAIFIRDPDRNVIEFDNYPGQDPASRFVDPGTEIETFKSHP